jgi:Uma2 family endonuclease
MPPTKLKFGPADHGRPVSEDELKEAEYVPGFSYEVIDGRFYVAPAASFHEHRLEHWLRRKLERFADSNPQLVGWVANKARVFIPGRPELTVPEPDLALYRENLSEVLDEEANWPDFQPFIVAEVLLASDPAKDLVRNVDLYLQVPSIAEYWILDGRTDPARPAFTARRRWRKRWVPRDLEFGDTYTTRTLPGFELLIDPKK